MPHLIQAFAHTVRAMFLVIAMVAISGCATQTSTTALPEYDKEQATAEIWQKELAIYKARGNGDLQTYLDNASDNYLGWPPGWDKPEGLDRLRAGVKLMSGNSQEEVAMYFADITFSGTAAIIYYDTHRTRLPRGEIVDQRFDIVHVWALEESEWKLLGALGRTKLPKSSN